MRTELYYRIACWNGFFLRIGISGSFYFFGRKKVNKKLLAKNKLYGVSINVSALITHFGDVLPDEFSLM